MEVPVVGRRRRRLQLVAYCLIPGGLEAKRQTPATGEKVDDPRRLCRLGAQQVVDVRLIHDAKLRLFAKPGGWG